MWAYNFVITNVARYLNIKHLHSQGVWINYKGQVSETIIHLWNQHYVYSERISLLYAKPAIA